MSEDQAYVDGLDAGRAGEALTSNPHPAMSRLFQAWVLGWLDARDERARKRKAR